MKVSARKEIFLGDTLKVNYAFNIFLSLKTLWPIKKRFRNLRQKTALISPPLTHSPYFLIAALEHLIRQPIWDSLVLKKYIFDPLLIAFFSSLLSIILRLLSCSSHGAFTSHCLVHFIEQHRLYLSISKCVNSILQNTASAVIKTLKIPNSLERNIHVFRNRFNFALF